MFHPSMKEKMDQLENMKASYESKIRDLQMRLNGYKKVDKEKIVLFLESKKGLKNKSLDDLKIIIQTFIDKVSVFDSYIEISSVVLTEYGGESHLLIFSIYPIIAPSSLV